MSKNNKISFQKIRNYIYKEAEERFSRQLRGAPFVPFRLQIKRSHGQPRRSVVYMSWSDSQCELYVSKWREFIFNINSLLSRRKVYILTSVMGAGKTTFLFMFAFNLIKNTNTTPILINSSEMGKNGFITHNELKKLFTSKYEGTFFIKDLEDFFDTNFEQQSLVFLFDGFDQAASIHLIEWAINNSAQYPMIISLRPSKASAMAESANLPLLRIKFFSQEKKREYFGNDYKRVRRVLALVPYVASLPLFSYIMRILLKDRNTDDIFSKTELYKRLLDYITNTLDTHISRSREKPELIQNIFKILKRLSYQALAVERPHIQKIPISFLYHVDTSLLPDDFVRVGIVNLIHMEGQPYLSFIHKSFQEFLAAQFVNEHQEYIEKILQHMWAPKWREVLKFLAGLKGEKVIKEVYAQKDNIIHATLFLCAECLSETRNVCIDIRENITDDLKKLVYTEPFWIDAIEMLGSLGG